MKRSRPAGWFGARLAVAAAVLAATPLAIIFRRVLLFGETFGDRDLAAYYHPAKRLVAALAIASGGVPTWNPFFGSGQPFAANPEHEVFHPLTTLFFVLPFEIAFRLQVILPLLVALPGMYFLLRTLRRSQPAALFGALCWGAGGYLLSTANLLPQLFAGAPLPLTLAFGIRVLRRPGARDVAGLALCFGCQCLAGEPSTLVVVPLLALAAAAAERRHASKKSVACALAGLLLGAALGAVILLPGAHHAAKTDRAHGLAEAEASDWSMPVARALDLVTPYSLGHVVAGHPSSYWGGSLYGSRESPYFYSLYPGLLATLLAFLAWRRRALWPWLAVAGFGFLLALGRHAPLWPLVGRMPLLRGIRFPEKFALLWVFPLVVAAAAGLDWVVLGRATFRRVLARWAMLPALAGVVVAVGLGLTARWLPGDFPLRETIRDTLRIAAMAAVVVLLARPRWRLGRRGRGLLACAALAIDLGLAGISVVHTTTVAELSAPPAVLLPLLKHDEDQVLFHAAEWHPSMQVLAGMARPPIPAQWGLALTLERDFDRTFLAPTNLATRMFWRAVGLDSRLRAPLLERRGVTAIVRIRPGSRWDGDRVVGPDGRGVLEVLATKNARPILSAMARVERVSGADAWLATALRLGSEMRDTALVDDANLPALAQPPAPADIRIAERAPNHLAAEVVGQGPGPSFLAFNQTWDEGWHLTVDGKPAPLLRADIALSGLLVPPGAHLVTLAYRDPWIYVGLAISVAAALACLLLVLANAHRRRDPGGQPAA